MTKLHFLDLDHNELIYLPPKITKMTSLGTLLVDFNKFEIIPEVPQDERNKLTKRETTAIEGYSICKITIFNIN